MITAYSPEHHFYKYCCYVSRISVTSAIITMFVLQRSLKTTSGKSANGKVVLHLVLTQH